MNYKLLEPKFFKSGFRFRQIFREGDIAIFHKAAIEPGIDHKLKRDAGFETVVISRHDGYTLAGIHIEPAECYPSSSEWGSKGWTYQTFLDAEKRFEILLGKTTEEIKEVANELVPVDLTMPAKTRKPRGQVLDWKLPTEPFTIKELEAFNPNNGSAYLWLMESVKTGTIKEVGERAKPEGQRGRSSKTFAKA